MHLVTFYDCFVTIMVSDVFARNSDSPFLGSGENWVFGRADYHIINEVSTYGRLGALIR
jgi:hypothetical protein